MSKRGLGWYKRDPIAFLDGVQGLGPDVIGAYAVLLDLIYARGGETRRDDRHLSGVLGCSVRKATALTDALIEARKIEFHDGFITNSRAKTEAKETRNLSEARAKAGRKGGENGTGDSKNRYLDQAKAQANASIEIEKEKRVDIGDSSESPTSTAQARDDGGGPPTHRERLLAAIGVNPVSGLTGHGGRMLGTMADMEVAARWATDLGLTEDEQVAVIAEVMATAPRPPSTFRYFDPAMQKLAAAKVAPTLQPAARSAANVRPHAAFDVAHKEFTRRVSAGEIDLGPDPSDPWAYVDRLKAEERSGHS